MSEIKIPLPAALAKAQWDRFAELMTTQVRGVAFTGPRFFLAMRWETDERPRWEGRNWRRLKRERRKFMATDVPA